MDIMEEFERWARKDVVKRILPRDIGIPRKIAEDEVDVIGYVDEQKGVDCYAAVFANWQIVRRKFDVVFLDVDAHNKGLDYAHNNMQKILRLLHEYEVRVYFTGRGFHVYLYMPLTRIELYSRVCKEWAKRKGILGLFDDRPLGDMRRMARIPYTKNSKVGMTMIEIDWRRDLDEILGMSKDGVSDRIESGVSEKLAEELLMIENELLSEQERIVVNNERRYFLDSKNVYDLPRCMREGIMILAETGELEHYWRVALAIFLLKVWGFEDVRRLFEMFASDYNKRKTEYQLRFIQEKGYKCYSCKSLKLMGICPYDDMKKCAYYILSNGWLENIVGGADVTQ